MPELRPCPLLNVSHCPHTAGERALAGFLVVAYNPLSRPRRAAPIRLPVRPPGGDGDGEDGDLAGGGFAVWELAGGLAGGRRRPVPSQLLPASAATRRLQASTLGAVAEGRRARRAGLEDGFGTHDIAFVADEVPAFGHRAFLVQRLAGGEEPAPAAGAAAGAAGAAGAVVSARSSEQRFGLGGDPLPPGAWPKPVVVGNYDEAAGGGSNETSGGDGIRLSFDRLSGRLFSVIGGGGFSPQDGRGGGKVGQRGGESGGWGPLPATMAIASYLPHVGTHPPFASGGGYRGSDGGGGGGGGAPLSPACPVVVGPGDPRTQAAAAAAAAVANSSNILAGFLQNSGAYIFRPDKLRPRALDAAADASGAASGSVAAASAPSPPPIPAAALRGPVLQEVRMDFADWASLAVRVWPLPKDDCDEPTRGGRRPPGATAGAASASAGAVVEVEWTVGPLPAWDDRGPGEARASVRNNKNNSNSTGSSTTSSSSSGHATAAPTNADALPTEGPEPLGREAVFRLSTALLSRGVFFTDSNGREMQQRRRDARPWPWPADFYFEPVAANYHPVTSAAALGDGDLSAAVATDRAQGASSLEDGELELMVHRATPADDARGVGEPLRETAAGCRASPGRDPDGSVPSDACGRMVGGRRAGGTGGGESGGGGGEQGNDSDGDGDDDDQGPEAPADGGGGLIARGTFRVRFSPSRLLPRGSRLDQEELMSPLVLAFAPLPTPEDARALLAGEEEEEGERAAAGGGAAAAAATPSEPGGGIGGGDVDSPVRVVTLMRSDGLHGAQDAQELCDDEEQEEDGDGDDEGGESGGGGGPPLPAPPRCGAPADAAAAADPRTFIVRLAHVFAAGEDPDKMSLPAKFDLNVLFARAGAGLLGGVGGGASGGSASSGGGSSSIKRMTELSLTAAVPRADMPPRPRWRVAEDDEEEGGLGRAGEERPGGKAEAGRPEDSWPGAYWRGPSGAGRLSPPPPPFPTYDSRDHGVGPDAVMAAQGIVELYPMEVRTFEVELEDQGAGAAAAAAASPAIAGRAAAAPLPEAAAAAAVF